MRITNFAWILLCPVAAVWAQDEVVRFQFGEPVAWSLEQAHYLLSRMRHGNLELPTKKPSADDLSTNKVNNNRIEMLQTLLGASGGFSQQVGQKNRLTQQIFDRNTARRSDLQARQGVLRAGLIDGNAALAQLQKQRAALPEKCAADDAGAACRELDAAIKARQAENAVYDAEIKSNDAELLKIPDTAPDFASTTPAYGSTLQPMLSPAMLESLIAKSAFESPKLHASTMLDNFLQMQYEIIAKQVSLLRDELPDRNGKIRRLMFIE